ncbi:MAG: ACT domain-containing protein [Gemmatimonadaceae bacterium]|nr:ACT domain-containing protein [Gemmatimonadaceae bacterium]
MLARIGDYDAIVGRSATRISPELLKAGTKLKVVGRAGVGVDNVAVDVATSLGIAVINAPAGNTVAVAELFFGAAIGLLRQIPRAQSVMENGRWDRNTFLGRELKGKTLGIVGLGRIGSEVATRAHAFGMTVVGYDPYIADERFIALRVRRAPSLDALLHETNILTVHVPLTDETKGMIGKRELARLPNRSVVVNMARGGIVDEAALLAALESEQLRGAALDVFDAEPLAADSPLRKAPNLLLTPHLGANTVEAQGALLASAAAGVLDGVIETDRLNLINARSLAEARGLEMSVGESSELAPRTVEVALAGGMQQLAVTGSAPDGSTPRLTQIGSFHIDVNPRHTLLILTNHDVPGVIGRVGTLLGERHVNIAEYHQARLAQGGDALAAVSVDGEVSEATRKALLDLPDVVTASVVHFRDEP